MNDFLPKMPLDTLRRRSIRLPGYDYSSAGSYFLTLCSANKRCLFGGIIDNSMHLNRLGTIVREEWLRTPSIRPEMSLDEFVIMPNHIHGIVTINVGAHGSAPADGSSIAARVRVPRSLAGFVAGFKSITTVRINVLRETPGERVWQRNYYEHIIRDDEDLERIREYNRQNPAAWASDPEWVSSHF